MNELPFDPPEKRRIDWLRRELRRHNELYYNQANPEVSDDRYDAWMAELRRLEQDHPRWDAPDSPTKTVGAAPEQPRTKKDAFQPHRHAAPMLSIANTYSSEEVRKFIGRVQGALREAGDAGEPRFVVELKIDGVAFTAFYRNGEFVRGATRGDGGVGEDVTTNLRAVKGIPKKLAAGHPAGEIEVRGEIYMPTPVFAALARDQEEEKSMQGVKTAKKAPLFRGYPDILSVKDLQRALGVGKAAAYGLLENKSISSIRIGRVYKIPKTALINYVESIK
jgi:DNA ligase (NAD+)